MNDDDDDGSDDDGGDDDNDGDNEDNEEDDDDNYDDNIYLILGSNRHPPDPGADLNPAGALGEGWRDILTIPQIHYKQISHILNCEFRHSVGQS